jgi:cytochrome b561
MTLNSTPYRWGAVARAFHWLTAIGVIALIAVGLWMTGLPTGIAKINIYALHKSFGITLLGLAVLRLLWRLLDDRPLAPAGQPRWQQRAAGATHVLLYFLLIAMPLSGWLYNSAAGFPLRWFKLVNLPHLVDSDPALKELAHQAHEFGAWLLIALLALHVAAALKHHFVDRDDTLNAMLGRRAKDSE